MANFVCLTADVFELKELVQTAEQSQFPDCEFLQQLKAAVAEAERCANVAIQLVNRKHRTRSDRQTLIWDPVFCVRIYISTTPLKKYVPDLKQFACFVVRSRHANSSAMSTAQPARLSLDELQAFMQQLESLPCVVREAELVQVLQTTGKYLLCMPEVFLSCEPFNPQKWSRGNFSFQLWAAVSSRVWRNWQVICFWGQSLLDCQFSQQKKLTFFVSC